jgi:hypothetical protein
VTGTAPKKDIGVLINAILELQKNPPDRNNIKEGLSFLENPGGTDIIKELMSLLQKSLES